MNGIRRKLKKDIHNDLRIACKALNKEIVDNMTKQVMITYLNELTVNEGCNLVDLYPTIKTYGIQIISSRDLRYIIKTMEKLGKEIET